MPSYFWVNIVYYTFPATPGPEAELPIAFDCAEERVHERP